jgi:hypothetical protein
VVGCMTEIRNVACHVELDGVSTLNRCQATAMCLPR